MILLVQIIATARAVLVLDYDNAWENLRKDKRNAPQGQNYGPSSPAFCQQQ